MLHMHSHFHLGQSLMDPKEIVRKAKEYGYSFAALADPNLCGIPKLVFQARVERIKPLVGMETTFSDARFSVFCRDRHGYQLLVRYVNHRVSFRELWDSPSLVFVLQQAAELPPSLPLREWLFRGILQWDSASPSSDPAGLPELLFPPVLFFAGTSTASLEIFRGSCSQNPYPEMHALGIPFPDPNALQQMLRGKEAWWENLQKIVESTESFSLAHPFQLPLPPFQPPSTEKGEPQPQRSGWLEGIRAALDPRDPDGETLLQRVVSRAADHPRWGEEAFEKRLRMELQAITRNAFSRYLLLAADIVQAAHECGAMVGPGRGSAVSSLLVHLLGITAPDPLEHQLLFERFVNAFRKDPPDIDLDVEDRKRQQVILFLQERYGEGHVAGISTFGTFGERLILRELERKHKSHLSPSQRRKFQGVFSALLGKVHHFSTHAAGLLFSQEDLRDFLPLFGGNNAFPVCQYGMDDLRELGMVKMDLLGLNTLSLIKDCQLTLPRPEREPLEHFDIFRGESLGGVFQLDSPSGRALLEKFQPRDFPELRIVISLNRPGPIHSGLADRYLQNVGREPFPKNTHPQLQQILASTAGVPVFQEQILRICMEVAGFSPEAADAFRNAMAKKMPEKMQERALEFRKGCERSGMSEREARELLDQVREFSGYAFNKAHATAYAYLTFWTGWLKRNHPQRFFPIFLDGLWGREEKVYSLLEEMRMREFSVHPPDLQRSQVSSHMQGNDFFLGLRHVREVSQAMAEEIVAARQQGEFANLGDFFERLEPGSLSERAIQNLHRAGAFECLQPGVALEEVMGWKNRMRTELAHIGGEIFGQFANVAEGNTKRAQTRDLLTSERFSLGILVSYPEVFGLPFSPFGGAERLKLVHVTEVLLPLLRYKGFDGSKEGMFECEPPGRALALGEKVVVGGGENLPLFLGTFDPREKRLEFQGEKSLLFFSLLEGKQRRMKRCGMQSIRVSNAAKWMEVDL